MTKTRLLCPDLLLMYVIGAAVMNIVNWSHSRSQWKKALEYSNPFQAGAIEDCDGEKDYFAANVDEYTAADGDMMNVLLRTNVNFDSIWSSRSLMV